MVEKTLEELEEIGVIDQEDSLVLTEREFLRLFNHVRGAKYSSEKIRMISAFLKERTISCEQLARLFSVYDLDSRKRDTIIAIVEKIEDPENFETFIAAIDYLYQRDTRKVMIAYYGYEILSSSEEEKTGLNKIFYSEENWLFFCGFVIATIIISTFFMVIL